MFNRRSRELGMGNTLALSRQHSAFSPQDRRSPSEGARGAPFVLKFLRYRLTAKLRVNFSKITELLSLFSAITRTCVLRTVNNSEFFLYSSHSVYSPFRGARTNT